MLPLKLNRIFNNKIGNSGIALLKGKNRGVAFSFLIWVKKEDATLFLQCSFLRYRDQISLLSSGACRP